MILELKNIEKSFGEKKVLSGISLQAESGRAFGILGRNGAGKTTAIRILMGVFSQDSGQVLVDGKPIDRRQLGLGYLPEERGLYPQVPISKQLCYFAELKGMEKKAAGRAVDYWLDRLDMNQYRNKCPNTLSKGNQQKIQMIAAVAHNPDVVILDEPFSGLDPVNAVLLKDVVKELIAENKVVLFSSHQMNYIEEFCQHIGILHGGKMVLQGNLRKIRESYPQDKLLIRSKDAQKILQDFGTRCRETETGELLLTLEDPTQKKATVAQLAQHYDLEGVQIYLPTLNDIFVQYTEGDMTK